MKKILHIENLEVLASVGVYEKEKNRKQKLIFNIKLKLSNDLSAKNDLLKDVIDYSQFRKIVIKKVENKHYNLLEKLAEDILNEIRKVSNVKSIKIKITKPDIFEDCTVSFQLSNN